MKHSTITNPDDLHYAKARIFSGDPALIAPDFPDQILVSTSGAIFRATGTALGALAQLGGGDGGSGALWVRNFTGDPYAQTPDFINQLLISDDDGKAYIGWGSNEGEVSEVSRDTTPPITIPPKTWTPLTNPNFQGEEQLLETGKSYVCVANYFSNLQCRLAGDVNKQIEISPTSQRITLRLKPNTLMLIGGMTLDYSAIENAVGEYLVLAPMTYFSCVLAFSPSANKQVFFVLEGVLNWVDSESSDPQILQTFST